MGPDAMIFVFWMLSFKPTFSLSSDSYPINPQPNPVPELFLLFFKSKKMWVSPQT